LSYIPRMAKFAGGDFLAGDDGAVGGLLETMPEVDRRLMHAAKFFFEVLDLAVAVSVAVIKAPPSAKTAAEAESQVVDLAEAAPVLIVRRDRALECPGG